MTSASTGVKTAWAIRALLGVLCALLTGWIVSHTAWVEVEETNRPSGAAALPYYSLAKIATAAGASLERRSALEPMPPASATLFLDSMFWNLFPERDDKLRDWVAHGGHLVLLRRPTDAHTLRWLPPTFVERPRAQASARRAAAAAAASAAPARASDDEDDDATAPPRRPPPAPSPKPPPRPGQRARPADPDTPVCESLVESPGSQAAFEPGRTYQRCLKPSSYGACVNTRLIPSPRARPQWLLGNETRSYAMRVPYGQGSVTTLADCLPSNNDALLLGDHALIAAAVLGLHRGASTWIVDDEAGEALPLWLWHKARAPLLLALAAVALALWRLIPRFGPRLAAAGRARRSMGEQVRGTGEFIAATDPQALHAATCQALAEAARTRVEGYAALDDAARIGALAARLGAGVRLDRAALLAALHPGPRSTRTQWLAAIALIEQARRALLRAS